MPRETRADKPKNVLFRLLGPGLVTGAADDDPSGISTYSITGAAFGYGLLWTALVSFPLMASVQMMCGRLGMVTGRGLAGVVRRRYSKWVLWSACALLVIANVTNIAADLGGMADATHRRHGDARQPRPHDGCRKIVPELVELAVRIRNWIIGMQYAIRGFRVVEFHRNGSE